MSAHPDTRPANGAPLLDVTGLRYAYGGVPAVVDCTLRVETGQVVALIGANGAGKSTSVKMIAGALRSQAGRIVFDGTDIAGRLAHDVHAQGLVLVPEGRLVFQHLTVRENLLVAGGSRRGRTLNGGDAGTNVGRVFDLFPRLKERARQNAGSLSGGEQQMLAIARGLMVEPRLLILDEPSLGLSPKLVATVVEIIERLNGEGTSVLLVEQNVHLSLAIADHAYVLEKGRVVREGPGPALLEDPAVKEAYLGVA